MKTLSATELIRRSKSETNARKRIRLLAAAHFDDGANRSQIARMLKVSRRSVNIWIENYLSLDVEGLDTKKQKGRESYMSSQQQSELTTYIDKQSQSDEGGRLTGESIRQYIIQHYGITYHPNAIYKLLHHLGFSWITSRSRHPKQSQAAQDVFKKTKNGNDQNDPQSCCSR